MKTSAPIVPAPAMVTLELATACNYSCAHCAVSLSSYRGKVMDRALAFSVIDSLAQLPEHPQKVQLSGHGESTILPWYAELFRHVRNRLPATAIGVHTNGSTLHDQYSLYVGNQTTDLAISMDGTGAVLDAIRGSGAYERIIRGLLILNEAKRQSGAQFPILSFVCVLSQKTITEVPKLVYLANQLSVGTVILQPITAYEELGTSGWRLSLLSDAQKLECRELLLQSEKLARSLGVRLLLAGDSFFDEPEVAASASSGTDGDVVAIPPGRSVGFFRRCVDPWHTAFINVHGRFNTCSHRHTDARESLSEQTFSEIWYGSAGLNRVRTELQTGCLSTPCAQCAYRERGSQPVAIPPRWGTKEPLE